MNLTIPAHKKSALEKKLVRINKKAVRNGFNPITVVFGDKYYKKVQWTFRHDVGVFENKDISVAFRDVVLDYSDLIKVNGCSIIGMLEKIDSTNNLVTLVTDDHGLNVADLRTKKEFFCDHCNTGRAYKYLGIVRHDQTGTIRFVGKSCLSEYIGIDITTIINMMDYNYYTNCVRTEDEEGCYGSFPAYFDFNQLIAHAFNGMVHANFVYDDNTRSCIMVSFLDTCQISNVITEEMAKAFKDYCVSLEQSNSSFEQNLYSAASGNYVHQKALNIVIGGFCSWLKKQKRNEAIANDNANNTFFGTVGKREAFDVTPTSIRFYSSQYGDGVIVNGVITGTSDKFTWFTSVNTRNYFICTGDNGDIDVRSKESFKILATVKTHKTDDKFGNSTILSRIDRKSVV